MGLLANANGPTGLRAGGHPFVWVSASVGLAGVVGLLDFATGYELSFGLFYLGAVGLATWRVGRGAGLGLAVLSAAIWLAADSAAGAVYSEPLVPYWNALIRFGFFVVVAVLLATLRETLARERGMARIDALTGANNRREFLERLTEELARSRRYSRPLTVVSVDLDHFKKVNDTLGHAEGDRVLSTVAQSLLERLRTTDTVARFGGDEFVLILPETGLEQARSLVEVVQAELVTLMRSNGWPVTFSIGGATTSRGEIGVDEFIGAADELMYRVKEQGRNDAALELIDCPFPSEVPL